MLRPDYRPLQLRALTKLSLVDIMIDVYLKSFSEINANSDSVAAISISAILVPMAHYVILIIT